MRVGFLCLASAVSVLGFSEQAPDLLLFDSESEIDKWLKLDKPKKYETLLKKEKSPCPTYSLNAKEVVFSSLDYQWRIQVTEREVDRREGIVQASKGPFDPRVGGGYTHQWLHDTQTFGFKSGKDGNLDSLQVFLEKLTRLGTRFSLNGEITRELNPSLSFDNSFIRTNATTLTFFVDQPLLKRFRYNEESVNEAVNQLELDAVRNELTQTMAENVRDAMRLYWDLAAAQKVVTINENAQNILLALASATDKLVQGERVAASELNEQFAELARNNRELVASQQVVYTLFNSLLFKMGMRRDCFEIELPTLELDEFPPFSVDKSLWDLDHLICMAMHNRGDLIAAQFRVQEGDMRLRLANQDIYPELNIRFGYDLFNSQINQKARPFFSSTETHKAQNDYTVAVNFSYPLFNNLARGEKRRREEEKIQLGLEEDFLSEDIRQLIASAFRNHMELIDQVHFQKKSVTWYEKALRDEILRFKEGYGSLFIIIDFENRLRLTLVEEARLLADWAKNLVELLFLTGALIERNPCTDEMQIDILNYQKLLVKDG